MCNAVSVIALQQHSWALEVTQNIFYTCTVFSHGLRAESVVVNVTGGPVSFYIMQL